MAVIFCAPAFAEGAQPTYRLSEIRHDPRAPKKYLYFVPYMVTEHMVASEAQVRAKCNELVGENWMSAGGRKDLGCHTVVDGRHHIVFLKGKPHVYWHEIAHSNGFKHATSLLPQ